ncbi:MAG: hydantoinase B/oxoprolinase family protein [Chloroflexi bacterium]|nr:hydantoinase B/oxoprolinase family protein [Chloroflexota bacterium]
MTASSLPTQVPSAERLGAVTRELVREALAALGDQMSLTLVRTSHSDTVKSAMDFSSALCDTRGRLIAQGLTLPNQLGSIPDAAASVLRNFEDDLDPGDMIVMNDPFDGGMHLPDIFLFKPVFKDGAMIGLIATVAHHTDVGGKIPGSMAPDCDEVYQEGLRIPAVKFYERGKPSRSVHAFIRANVRVPDIVMGDFGAQVAACNVGEAGFLRLVETYGLAAFNEYVNDLMDYSERLTRTELRAWPNGTYTNTDYIDDDGIRPEPIPISVTITLDEDTVTVDFAGSSPQIPAALNCTPSFMKACTYCALRSLMRADVPMNDGFFRPITVTAPPATIVNCVLPAATATRGLTGFRIIDAIFGALAGALPDRVPAASDGGLTIVGIGGYRRDREPFVLVELLSGSWGGRPDRDGIEGMPNLGANISNIPVEMVEVGYPLRIERYGFVPDTGGAGKYRGGLSILRDFRFLEDASLTVRSDRQKILPFGLHGGREGTPAMNLLVKANGEREVPPSKFLRHVKAGDLLQHVMAGGGGFGDPLERDPEAVLRDVREERLSAGYVLREYGVVLRDDLSLDREATVTERARRCGQNGEA